MPALTAVICCYCSASGAGGSERKAHPEEEKKEQEALERVKAKKGVGTRPRKSIEHDEGEAQSDS